MVSLAAVPYCADVTTWIFWEIPDKWYSICLTCGLSNLRHHLLRSFARQATVIVLGRCFAFTPRQSSPAWRGEV